MKTLIDLLREYDLAYHNGEPLVSDEEYDLLKLQAEKEFPDNIYFTQVGAEVRGGKVKLPYTMGGLNQIYENEFSHWVQKYNAVEENITITDKEDGVSNLVIFSGGTIQSAFSRGDGINGADVTRHVRYLKSIPKSIAAPFLVVRGEIIMANDTFAEKYSSQYSNPRSMVAGCMNRKESDSALGDMDFIAYQIVDASPDVVFSTKAEMLRLLEIMGFKVPHYHIAKAKDIDDAFLKKHLFNRKALSPYSLDGLVLTINTLVVDKQTTSSSLNPEESVKFKEIDAASVVKTAVADVHWEISKSGFLKPRVEIIPVELFGTVVKFATGFNAKFINDNGIGKGAEVMITKAGEVIPYIKSVISPKIPKLPSSDLNWEWNESGVEIVVAQDHPEVVFKQVLDFFDTLKIDLLKEASLRKICERYTFGMNASDSICLIMDLQEAEWRSVIGVNGTKIYESILSRCAAMPLEVILGASPHMGIGFGVRRAKMLLAELSEAEINDLQSLTVSRICEISGFDEKTASQVVAGIPPTLKLFEKLKSYITVVKEEKTSELKDLNVVFTGFRDADLEKKIESMGGKVASGVSKKTTLVVAADPNNVTGKVAKARELNIDVCNISEFKFKYQL